MNRHDIIELCETRILPREENIPYLGFFDSVYSPENPFAL